MEVEVIISIYLVFPGFVVLCLIIVWELTVKSLQIRLVLVAILTTLLLWLEFHYRMLGFLEKVLTDFALHGLPW